MPQTETKQNTKGKVWPWVLGCFGLFLFLGSFVLNVFLFFSLFFKTVSPVESAERQTEEVMVEGKKDSKEKIALIELKGPIFYRDDSWQTLVGKSNTDFVISQLKQAKTDKNVMSIVLFIQSPGGSITASDEIYNEIILAKKAGKKVVAFLNETAASGGYYVALPADKIIASPTTITGSIGAIAQTYNIEELLKKYGVQSIVVKSGKYKDLFSPTRGVSDEEREIVQSVIDEYQRKFVELLRQNRKIDEAKISEISDGRIFTANKALELNLIDSIGYLDEAIGEAVKLAKIKEKTIIKYKQPFDWESLFGNISSNFSKNFFIKNLVNLAVFDKNKILYLW